LVLGSALMFGGSLSAAVVFSASTSIGAGEATYDGQDVTVQGCTVTVSGQHEFASLTLRNGATLAIGEGSPITVRSTLKAGGGGAAAVTVQEASFLSLGGGSSVSVEGLLLVAGNSTVLCRGRNTAGKVDGQWAGGGAEIAAADITVEAGSRISADGQGYQPVAAAPGNGPGGGWGAWGTIGHGAGHGGAGGGQAVGYGLAYGSADEPVDLGSAGGGLQDGGLGGAGGGAIRLQVTGTLALDGRISADATAPTVAWYPGGGAGGSIWVTAGRLAGSGTLQANGSAGGLHSTGGGGGGGRIAVYYGADGGFTGFVRATTAGAAGGAAAAPGTIAFFCTATAKPHLYVYQRFAIPDGSRRSYHGITTDNGATLTLGGGSEISVDGQITVTGASTLVCGSRNGTGRVAGEWRGEGVSIQAGGVTVETCAAISADGQGYQPVAAAPGNGPGGGWGALGTIGHGAGPGGVGGGQAVGYGLAYGSADEPVDLGSAGGGLQDGGLGGAGGGAIRLQVTGTLTLAGRISANATAATGAWYPGGGAGGSIWITAGRLAGSGTLQANGSAGGLYSTGGGGGGGRIAVYYGIDGGFGGFTTTSAAAGPGGAAGAPGTIAFVCTDGGTHHLFVYQNFVIPEGSVPSYTALTVGNGGTLCIGGGSRVTVDGLLHVTGNSTVLCRSRDANDLVDGQWAGRGVEVYAADITIDSGSRISADGLGYEAAPAAPGNGPGAGWGTNGTIARGAGHGGRGGCEVEGYGDTYGSAVFPVDLGSSGGGCQGGGLGGPGGGAILLQVAGTLTVDGRLSADAGPVSVAWYPGGGAGGSLCVNARSVVGAGTLSAKGSAGGVYFHVKHAGKGGGGRVAVYCWDHLALAESQIAVDPGDDGNPAWPAEAGSRFISSTPQFLVLQPDRSAAHGIEPVRWVALATDASALSVDLAAYRIGTDTALTLGTGLPALGRTTWDTAAAADGFYELRASFRDATGTVVGAASRAVVVNNAAAWHAGRLEADQTWGADRVHVVEGDVSIAPGVRLTVEPGAVVKFASRLMLTVEGGATLAALATAAAPIVLTSLADDAVGGDTNADGELTLPRPGDWLGVAVQSGGQFLSSAFVAVRYIASTHSGVLASDEAWPGDAVHHLSGDVIVPNNVTLTLNAGAVLKLAAGRSIIVQSGGTLAAAGSAAQPVVITSERDDSVGGDSNGDGSTTEAAAGDWHRIYVDGGVADFRYVQMRYGAGTDSVGAALIRSNGAAQVTVANSVLADGLYTGILAWGGAVAVTNTVIAGLDRGISAHPGSPVAVTNCTLDGNRIGLLVHGGGLIAVNSIVSNSLAAGVQFDFGTALDLRYCDVWSGAGALNYSNTADLSGSAGNLSVEPLYKDRSRRNFRLDYRSPCIDAGDGSVAPATDLAGALRYNDPRTPDSGVPMPGRAAAAVPDLGAFEFVETAASAIDLTVNAVIGPLAVTAGETVTLQWTVTNQGTTAATGPWHDTVYLVRDPVTAPVALPVGEVLVGQGVHLGPGQSATVSGSLRVPGSTATPHRWQVTTNTRGEVFEGQNTANNSALSAALVSLGLPPLAVDGGAVAGQFGAVGESQWFAFTPAAGQDVRLSLDLFGSGATELYVGYGRMPSRQQYDVAATPWNAADVSALVSGAGGQTCYVLVYAAGLGGTPAAFSLRAEALSFALAAVTPAQCGQGPVTFRVGGGQLREGMTWRLIGPGRAEYVAVRVFLVNSALAYVTFDLTGAATGAYGVEVEVAGALRSLPAAVSVSASAPGRVEFSIDAPAATRPGWVESLTIHYRNAGTTDVVAPLLHFVVVGADPPDYSGFVSMVQAAKADDPPVYMARYWLGVSPEGPAGVLPPGVGGEFTVEVDPAINTGAVEYQLRAVTEPSLGVDWEAIKSAAKPAFVADEAWQAAFGSYRALVGPTVGEFQEAMARQATYLSSLGERVSEVSDLSYLALAESGFSQIVPRYALGALGRGRTHPYDIWGEVRSGAVLLYYPGRVRQFAAEATAAAGGDATRYVGVPGDRGVLVAAASGAWSLTEPEGGAMVFVPDSGNPARHRLAHCEDRNGNRTTLEYADGRVTRVVFADVLATTYQYNNAGRLVRATDSFGTATTFTYDAGNEYLMSVTGDGLTTTYSYVSGQGPAREHALASRSLPDGRVVEFEYDSLGRMVRGSEAVSGWEQTVAYGPGPRRVVTGPEGGAVDLRCNRFGQVGQVVGPLGDSTEFSYDEAKNLTGLAAPGGVRCSMAYDASGQRTALIHGSGGQMGATYGPFGLLARLVDPLGRVTAYERDARGNLLATTYPDGSRARRTVDSHGEPDTLTNRRGQTTRYHRDAQLRLSGVESADAAALDYSYDGRNRLTAATSPAGTLSLAYDDADRVTDVAYPGGRSLHYTYDRLGRRAGMEDQDGFRVDYAYDAAGRLEAISAGARQTLVSYAYDRSGRLAREDRGNGTYSTYAYDAAGRLTLLAHRAADGTELARFAYGYDAAGRRASVQTAEGTWHYAYDGRSQLIQAVLPNGRTLEYTYDLAGNRTAVSDAGIGTPYGVNTLDQYVTIGAATRQYDADGNLTGWTAGSGGMYTHDSQSRLTAASRGAAAWSWEYDALGNRTATTAGGQRTEYLVDPTGIGTPVAEYDGAGNLAAHYVHGFGPVCRIDASGEVAFYSFDGNANAALLTGPDGTVLNRYAYLPFGEPLRCDETVPNPFRFAGRQGVVTDSSGLVQMRQRWYDPEAGRFLEPDPLGPFGGNANLYTYAANAPTLFTDPLGLYQSMEDMAMGELGMGALDIFMNPDTGIFSANPDYDKINQQASNYFQNHPWVHNAQHIFGAGGLLQSGTFTEQELHSPAVQASLVAHILTGVSVLSSLIHFNANFQGAQVLAPYTYVNVYGNSLSLGTVTPPTNSAAGAAYQQNQDVFNQFVLHNCHNPSPDQPLAPCIVLPVSDPSHDGRSPLDCPSCPKAERSPPYPGIMPTGDTCVLQPVITSQIPVHTAVDPNDIQGPAGAAAAGWIAVQSMGYTIRFENQATATAPAQRVVVTLVLDADTDWSTFELGSAGFGNVYIPVPSGLQSYTGRVDLRSTLGLYVDFAAALEPQSGVVTWTFTAIDPLTGQPTRDPLAGFLPPNLTAPEGEGYVRYRVRPVAGASTGSVVTAQASIVFDRNEAILTNTHVNTLDAEAPVSVSLRVLRRGDGSLLELSLAGSDGAGSGVASFDVYAAVDGGAAVYQSTVEGATGTLAGDWGHRYELTAVARDAVGQVMPLGRAAGTALRVPQWAVRLEAAAAAPALLYLGVDPLATAGFDPLLDEDAPAAGRAAGTVALLGPDAGHEQLLYDCQAQDGTVTWLLDVAPGADPVRLSWDPAAVPAARWLWTAQVDETGAPQGATYVDMVTARSLEIAAPGLWQVTLSDARTEAPLLEPAWNLVALGVTPADGDPGAVFGAQVAAGACWGLATGGWSAPAYQRALSLQPGVGYWVYCLGAAAPLVTGPAAPTSVALEAGWNLLGTGWEAVLPDDPAIVGVAWGWDAAQGAYSAVLPGEVLQAGRAYWIFSLAPATLDLPPTAAP
jgi:RHS repeat-associated protein